MFIGFLVQLSDSPSSGRLNLPRELSILRILMHANVPDICSMYAVIDLAKPFSVRVDCVYICTCISSKPSFRLDVMKPKFQYLRACNRLRYLPPYCDRIMLASGAYCIYHLYEPEIFSYYKLQYSAGIIQEEILHWTGQRDLH